MISISRKKVVPKLDPSTLTKTMTPEHTLAAVLCLKDAERAMKATATPYPYEVHANKLIALYEH